MAENEPVKAHPETEQVTRDETEAQATPREHESTSLVDPAPTDTALTQEPKDGASASDPPAPSDATPTGDAEVATVSGQVANPGPQDDALRSESQALDSVPAAETAPSTATTLATPAPAKRFTSMNINKKFLAKTAGSSSSSISPAPKASTSTSAATRPALINPQPSSRLITKKLTAAPAIAPASGGWSLRPTPPTSLSSSPAPGDVSAPTQSGKPLATADANHSNRPALVTSASGLSVDARSSGKTPRDQSPAKAWATIPTAAGEGKRNLQEFPTAAEAAADSAEHKRPGASTAQLPDPHGLDVPVEADTDARDSFRGMHLDPNAHHWDEMEDESNDFLGDVIDFGDGKTYAVPHEESGLAPTSTANRGSRFGDDYDRSWPRSQPPQPEPEGAHGSRHSQHGFPPRQPDGRHLFNERSNRLEPAKAQPAKAPPPTGGSTFHQHAPPFAHLPPRSAPRRNSTLSSSDRPKLGHGREPPPHARDLPPHAQAGSPTDGKTRRASDARSSHSPVERRSSFLHDEERPRIGSIGIKGRAPEDSGHGMRRETSHDSRLSGGDRRSWSRASSHPVDPLHHPGTLGSAATQHTPEKPTLETPILEASNASNTVRSPVQGTDTSRTEAPEPAVQPSIQPSAQLVAPAVLNEEREKYMKLAAERARRRRQEEETAREEARERARKKAAELEALSKASLVSASPLRQASGAKSPGSKSPLAKSPLITPSALPTVPATTELHPNKSETLAPESAAAAASSWRKPPPAETKAPLPAPDDKPKEPQAPPPPPPAQLSGIGMPSIDELDKADSPVEVMDFSDMSKLAERRTSITSPSESHRDRRRSTASEFLDEPLGNKRANQGQTNVWNRDSKPAHEIHEGRDRAAHGRQSSFSSKPTNEPTWSRATPPTGAGMSAPGPGPGSRPAFKEAPIAALDDVMLRIKGVLTDMHAEEKPIATGPTPAPSKAASGVSSRWIGNDTSSWRDNMGKKQPNGPIAEPTPTEPFANTRPERPDTPPPAWKLLTVHISKSSITRPPMNKKQVSLAKLPPMPVRWDILTWDPPVERMSNRTLSRDDVLFPKTYMRGVLSARVHFPSTGSTLKQIEPTQRSRLTATIDVKSSRAPAAITRPPPKSPAFMDVHWRKPQQQAAAALPTENALELQSTAPAQGEGNQLETTSRSPPPYHQADRERGKSNTVSIGPSSPSTAKVLSKPSRSPEVTFHRSLHEKRPSNPPMVSFTVSSELDEVPTNPEETTVTESPQLNHSAEVKEETLGEDSSGEKSEQAGSGGKTQSPTPNSSVLLTPPAKVTPPWQSSNSRLPDNEFIKSVWQHSSPKDTTMAENSLRGLSDDFPNSIPHSVQEMNGEPKSSQPATSVPSRMPHNAHRAFQVPTSPAPMHMHVYPNHMGNQVVIRPTPVSNFSLPPPAPPQPTAQPTPYSPYVHPTPTMIYGMPPNRIAPSPAPGPQIWMQGQPYGRPSPPAGMYPGQQGHAMSYPSPVAQLPPPLNKPHGGMNGNHGHHLTSPAMSHAMHMGSPAMSQVTHMGSPAMAPAVPHMPGPQHMYPGMNSPGGLGLGNNMGYGAQRPGPQMMQQSPMQAAVPNGYPMVPGGSYPPGGYGRGAMRNPSDGMPHHMAVPHPQHAPVSPAAYHPNAYGRW